MKPTQPILRRQPGAVITAIWILLFSAATLPAIQGPWVFNLNSDYSEVQNPNGAWSFDINDMPIGSYQTFWWGQSGWGVTSIGDGSILRGASAAGMIDPWGELVPPVHDWLNTDIMLHALSVPYGGGEGLLNVKWTSPGDGIIDVSGRAWDGQIYADREMRWTLSVGGELFASRDTVRGLYRTDAAAQFASNLASGHSLSAIQVTQGEVVQFTLAAETYYGHFVGLDETITFTAIPEPTIMGLILIGLLMARVKNHPISK